MKIDFRPSVIEGRIYKRGSYKERSPYQGSFVIHITGETASITLLTGTWDLTLYRRVFDYVQSLGVTTITYEVKGKKVIKRVSAA